MNTPHKISIGIIIAACALFAHTADAASFFFSPATGTVGVGAKVTVDLKIDSEGVGMNAAQATLRFPKETLEVTSIDKTSSTFNFWLTEPTFSNADGVISFAGGTPYGISGASMQVLRITFTTKGSGSAPITIADAAITASDGSGTNILSKTGGATITVSTTSTPSSTQTTTTPAIAPAPQQIVRPATPASNLPKKPLVTVPLYPDPTSWYSAQDLFTVRWDIPQDITGVSTSINKQPNFSPAENSEGLFDSKTFPALTDGTWYLHVRFQNNIGWGPTTHYRLAVDTIHPLPFEITSNENGSSDSPTQTLQFQTSDALSGITTYQIKVGSEDWVPVPMDKFNGQYTITFPAPGKYHIIVRATDAAGNSIENSTDHTVTPITSPAFTFVDSTIYSNDATNLHVMGTALPSTEISLSLIHINAVISVGKATVDTNGNWDYTFNDQLHNGEYTVNIQDKDERGATSLIVSSPAIQVKDKYAAFISVAFLLLGALLAFALFFFKRRMSRTSLRIEMAERDTANVFKMIQDDVQKLQEAQKNKSDVNAQFLADKIKRNADKMSKYIKDELGRARK